MLCHVRIMYLCLCFLDFYNQILKFFFHRYVYAVLGHQLVFAMHTETNEHRVHKPKDLIIWEEINQT